MTLLDLINLLGGNKDKALFFVLPSGTFVPAHFHVTEIGRVQKDFIDCGGTRRQTLTCNMQLWVAGDTDHRLTTTKLFKIFEKSNTLMVREMAVEVEYQQDSISVFTLARAAITNAGVLLFMEPKYTTCLAPDRCGISPEQFPQPGQTAKCCGSGCCC